YDAELQVAVGALKQILQAEDGPRTMSQDAAFAGVQATPMVTTQNVVGSVKKTVRKRKSLDAVEGPAIKKGPSQRNTSESSQKSSGAVGHQAKQMASSLKDKSVTLQNPTAPAASMNIAGPQDQLCIGFTDRGHGP
ncbi:hypothetical protein NDU88_001415, partial [Pleurodeles waltl]